MRISDFFQKPRELNNVYVISLHGHACVIIAKDSMECFILFQQIYTGYKLVEFSMFEENLKTAKIFPTFEKSQIITLFQSDDPACGVKLKDWEHNTPTDRETRNGDLTIQTHSQPVCRMLSVGFYKYV